MVKAYVNKGKINIVTPNNKISYAPGAEVINASDGKKSIYNLLSGSDNKFSATVLKELDRLYTLKTLPKNELVLALDKGRREKLYTGTTFNAAYEVIDGTSSWVFSFEKALDLLAFEILNVIDLGRPLKKCENCGKYFIPSGRADSVYCDRNFADSTCKKIGAHKKYRKSSNLNDIKKLYDKVTKHNRYLKTKGDIYESDYNRWIKTASQMYADFKSGAISENTLTVWLSKDISSRQSNRSISDYLL